MLVVALLRSLVGRPVQVPRLLLRRGAQQTLAETIVLRRRRMLSLRRLLGLSRLVGRRVGRDVAGPAGASLNVHAGESGRFVVVVVTEEGWWAAARQASRNGATASRNHVMTGKARRVEEDVK